MSILFTQFMLALFFLTIVFFHISKKNLGVAIMYGIQSCIIVVLMVNAFFETGTISLILIAVLLFVVKVILTPAFIIRLIHKHELKFLVSTYTNTPITLIIIAVLTAIAYSHKFGPLAGIVQENQQLLSLMLSALFISFFLIINRKGALSQIIGILSLENSIVAFAFLAGLEETPALQIGIIFDLFVWIVIATVFISMIYKHFGSLNVTEMRHLKD